MSSNNTSQGILTISKEQLSILPAAQFDGEIRLIENGKEIDEAVNELRKAGIIGFDTETRPSFKKG